MESLDLNVGRAVPPGIYRYAGRLSSAEILRHAAHEGWAAWQLNGHTISDKAAFLQASARAMRLPAYFGHNWDAFEECITDLGWTDPATGFLLVYDYPKGFASTSPDDWQTALAVLFDAVEYWRGKDRAFCVLLRRTHGAAPEVPLLR